MGKKKKSSPVEMEPVEHESGQDGLPEKDEQKSSPPELTSEMIEEDKAEPEFIPENSEYESHPKFHKFRGEK